MQIKIKRKEEKTLLFQTQIKDFPSIQWNSMLILIWKDTNINFFMWLCVVWSSHSFCVLLLCVLISVSQTLLLGVSPKPRLQMNSSCLKFHFFKKSIPSLVWCCHKMKSKVPEFDSPKHKFLLIFFFFYWFWLQLPLQFQLQLLLLLQIRTDWNHSNTCLLMALWSFWLVRAIGTRARPG